MEMFGLVVRFEVTPGHVAEFDELVAQTVAAVHAHEPETLAYLSHQVEGEPHARMFYEVYASPEAKDFHDGQPYVKHFMAERDRYLTGKSVQRLTPLAPWPEMLGGAADGDVR